METYRVEASRGSISIVEYVEARNASDAFEQVARKASNLGVEVETGSARRQDGVY